MKIGLVDVRVNNYLPVSIPEARKILGKKISGKLSDEEVEKLIIDLDELARMTLKAIREGTLKIPEEYKK